MLLETGNGLGEAGRSFVLPVMSCRERIICAKVQQQLLLLIKLYLWSSWCYGNRAAVQVLNLYAMVIKPLVLEAGVGC